MTAGAVAVASQPSGARLVPPRLLRRPRRRRASRDLERAGEARRRPVPPPRRRQPHRLGDLPAVPVRRGPARGRGLALAAHLDRYPYRLLLAAVPPLTGGRPESGLSRGPGRGPAAGGAAGLAGGRREARPQGAFGPRAD